MVTFKQLVNRMAPGTGVLISYESPRTICPPMSAAEREAFLAAAHEAIRKIRAELGIDDYRS